MRTVSFALIGILLAGAAYAQQPGPGPAGGPLGFGGQVATVGPSQTFATRPRPLFSFLGVPVGVWAPVPPPYNVAANRNLAASPID